jgi:carbamate kinase
VVTHGNGPQVGLLALQAEADPTLPRVPLDVLDAESEGMVGYLLAQALGRHLDPDRVVTLLTQVEVDPDDPAFRRPTKPIGPRYDASAERSLANRGWTLGPDGDGVRRLVPSPNPLRIVELDAVRLLSDQGFTVICTGGGGIPVARDGDGGTVGVEAVIDKDLASARLAVDLDVDEMVLATDVDGVYEQWGGPGARRLREVTVAEVHELDLAEGSMGPKVEAACRFVVATGRPARIGALHDLERLLAGEAGTTVVA